MENVRSVHTRQILHNPSHHPTAQKLLHQQTKKAVSFHYQIDILFLSKKKKKRAHKVSLHNITTSWDHGKKISLPRWGPFSSWAARTWRRDSDLCHWSVTNFTHWTGPEELSYLLRKWRTLSCRTAQWCESGALCVWNRLRNSQMNLLKGFLLFASICQC